MFLFVLFVAIIVVVLIALGINKLITHEKKIACEDDDEPELCNQTRDQPNYIGVCQHYIGMKICDECQSLDNER